MTITRRSFLSSVAMLTGSVAFGVVAANSDEDWLWMQDEPPDLVNMEDARGDYYPETEFKTFRSGNINLIVPLSNDFRQRWLKAHRHCMIERPRDKSRRVKVFRHYLYGESLH